MGVRMKFSLITVTMGDRPAELRRLKDSLAQQTVRDFEHIVIDHRDHPELHGSLSRARNLGLMQAAGDVIAFPDDDAWYAPGVLKLVTETLVDPDLDGVSFRVTDGQGACSVGGWMPVGRMLMCRRNIWRTAVSCSFFVRRQAIGSIRFDERLGVGSGTRFGSGEETDFLLRMMEAGARLLYDGREAVFHPILNGRHTPRRGWLYGNGCGRTLRRHGYTPFRLLWMASLQLVRCAQAMVCLKPRKAFFHLSMSVGRLVGYLMP